MGMRSVPTWQELRVCCNDGSLPPSFSPSYHYHHDHHSTPVQWRELARNGAAAHATQEGQEVMHSVVALRDSLKVPILALAQIVVCSPAASVAS